ncbi:MAG: adenine-specific methyltransferase EcoRI family protein [Planctomycetaceae bacterium]|nr:adenine-specific methyltransferase EcoRI family protein [Planctomycetaceae bacterium]
MTKKTGNTNTSLNKAKSAKNDEFYTQLADIEHECEHYKEQFHGKTILCNCDDPRVSNFFRYFFTNFYRFGLKRIISVCCKNVNSDLSTPNKDGQTVYCIYDGKDRYDVIEDGDYEAFIKRNEWNGLQGDGDFRSEECIELLKQADIVVTNPPFSLFREYVAQLMEHGKQFLIIGSDNAITYKEIFPLIKENELWRGYERVKQFTTDKNETKYFGNIGWYTNLDVSYRHKEMLLCSRYSPDKYPHYDNYDAIEVRKLAEIPCDWDGCMGVPITFLDRYNPRQFEILGSNRGRDQDPNGVFGRGTFLNGKETFKRIFIRKRIQMWRQ